MFSRKAICIVIYNTEIISWFWDEKWTWKHPNTFLSCIAQSHF